MSTLEFARGKDKQKRKARRKKVFSAVREQGRKDAREGTAGNTQRQALGLMASYAAGRGDVAVNRAKKKYSDTKASLGARGSAAISKAKDYLGSAKSAAGELTGKAKSAVSSGFNAVKEKAKNVLRKRKSTEESYARAIEALEFEVAKQIGILEFASGHDYIEFGIFDRFRKNSKGSYGSSGAGKGRKEGLRKTAGVASRPTGGAYRGEGVGKVEYTGPAKRGVAKRSAGAAADGIKGGALATTKGSALAIRKKGLFGGKGKLAAGIGGGLLLAGAAAGAYKARRGKDKQKRRPRRA